jgi:putative CocE/NonD family hydrolase
LSPGGSTLGIAGPGAWSLPSKRGFRVVENEWLTLRDGTRLASRLWIPDGAASSPVPVVLEYIPYRKRDATRALDNHTGRLLAQYGIAFARVDIRGSGDSEGILVGEYTRQEHEDALEIITWLAARPWANGSVGMRGISWGGFTTLQVAAMAPPELKAIMPVCFSDNQFTDDAHYLGGALCNANYYWGTMFQTVMTSPPDPEVVGERWRQMWLARLQAAPPILSQWTSHQRFDEHWKSGSVAIDYSRIKCAVYAVGGLTDHFVNVNARLIAHLNVPRKCLIGPWAHNYPDDGNPGPGLDWIHEEVRWWEHWLKGIETGIMDEPMFRIYLCEKTAVEVYPDVVPGRWIAEEVWPSPRISKQVLYLNRAGLEQVPGNPLELKYKADRIVGLRRGEPDAFFFPIDFPQDQAPDDELSMTFESATLQADVDVVGTPVLKVRVSADVEVAKLAVRLNEVTPQGQSWLISSGILNLTHRMSHEKPEPLEPGRHYDVEIPLFFMAKTLKRGNRIRVALSEGFWPLVWPSPQLATLTITAGVSALTLPVRPRPAQEAEFSIPMLSGLLSEQHPPTAAGSLMLVDSGPDSKHSTVREKVWELAPVAVPEVGTQLTAGWTRATMRMNEGDPNSCVWTGGYLFRVERGNWDATVKGTFEVTSSAATFHVKEAIEALEANKTVFERSWNHTIDRDLM